MLIRNLETLSIVLLVAMKKIMRKLLVIVKFTKITKTVFDYGNSELYSNKVIIRLYVDGI